MTRTLTSIFTRFKESYNNVLDANHSQQNTPLYLENLKEANKSLIMQLFGDKGVQQFEELVKKELK